MLPVTALAICLELQSTVYSCLCRAGCTWVDPSCMPRHNKARVMSAKGPSYPKIFLCLPNASSVSNWMPVLGLRPLQKSQYTPVPAATCLGPADHTLWLAGSWGVVMVKPIQLIRLQQAKIFPCGQGTLHTNVSTIWVCKGKMTLSLQLYNSVSLCHTLSLPRCLGKLRKSALHSMLATAN